MVTASPMKRIEKGEKGKVPLLRFTARGQEIVPNTENAAALTELSERLTDLEYESGHSFLKSLSLLVEACYLAMFLWCQMAWGCASRVVKYQVWALFQVEKIAASVVRIITRLMLAGIRLLLFGVTKGVVG